MGQEQSAAGVAARRGGTDWRQVPGGVRAPDGTDVGVTDRRRGVLARLGKFDEFAPWSGSVARRFYRYDPCVRRPPADSWDGSPVRVLPGKSEVPNGRG